MRRDPPPDEAGQVFQRLIAPRAGPQREALEDSRFESISSYAQSARRWPVLLALDTYIIPRMYTT